MRARTGLLARSSLPLCFGGHTPATVSFIRRLHSQHSTPSPAWVDNLREAVGSLHSPADFTRVLDSIVHTSRSKHLQEQGWRTVIGELNFRNDKEHLLALFDSEQFLPWFRDSRVSGEACTALIRALFRSPAASSLPDDDIRNVIARMLSRGGVVTPAIRVVLSRLYGTSIPDVVADVLAAEDELRPEDPLLKEIRTLRERGKLKDALAHLLRGGQLRKHRPNAEHFRALLGADVWRPKDVIHISEVLRLPASTGVWIGALENALHTSGPHAAREVFDHARNLGISFPHSTVQRIIGALTCKRDFHIQHPRDTEAAVDIFWAQSSNIWRRPYLIMPAPLVTSLSHHIGVRDRWKEVGEILETCRKAGVLIDRTFPAHLLPIYEDALLSTSHAEVITRCKSSTLSVSDLSWLLFLIGWLRYDDAPTMSYADFLAFIDYVKSCGHTPTDELVVGWLDAVGHSRQRLSLPWEHDVFVRAGSSSDHHHTLATNFLRQLQDEFLVTVHPELATPAVYSALLDAHNAGPHAIATTDDLDKCWTWLVEHDAVTDDILSRAVSSRNAHAQRVWDDALRMGVTPSTTSYVRYARSLISRGAREAGFAIIRDHVGDLVTSQYATVPLFALSPQDELEHYAKALPQTWRDPQTRLFMKRYRDHRRARGKDVPPQHYRFSV
ncbi:hypothetical protein EXIGLDRAFT_765183 [Exidia glandulosa HHB12029]|uniref:Uncharacterized protein n=1 Tax=Exidia glandulosa HHB12029 TaxID=1314781 RepID=A0A165KPN5_EXIGL|nr:hypothetical protein EXIGLDRAFT_765183 [Exidia glandulosa HHB12029]